MRDTQEAVENVELKLIRKVKDEDMYVIVEATNVIDCQDKIKRMKREGISSWLSREYIP